MDSMVRSEQRKPATIAYCAGMRIKRVEVHVPRKQLDLSWAEKWRSRLRNLEAQGLSLNSGQTQPLTATPGARGRLYVGDGYRRVTASDQGFCPDFTELDSWWVVVVTHANDEPLSYMELWRYCEATNTVRENWSLIDEARYYQAEVETAIAEYVTRNGNARLDGRTRKLLRGDVVRQLAAARDKSDRYIWERLSFLGLPESVQQLIEDGVLGTRTLRSLVRSRLPEGEMRQAIAEAMLEAGVPCDMFEMTDRVSLPAPRVFDDPTLDDEEGRVVINMPPSAARDANDGEDDDASQSSGTHWIPHNVLISALRRRTERVRNLEMRPVTQVREQITQLEKMARRKGAPKDMMKAVIAALRWSCGEAEDLPFAEPAGEPTDKNGVPGPMPTVKKKPKKS